MSDTTLTDAKRKLLEHYLQTQIDTFVDTPPVSQRQPGALAPLTFAQQQVWLHAQLAPDTPLYNEPFTVHRHGALDLSALRRSLHELIRRHEAWRTTFPVVDGQPVQKVGPPLEVKLPLVDLRNVPESERVSEALRIATEDARRPFDLPTGPLFRALLIRLDDEEYRLFITAHHIIFDGITGYSVFFPELVALYNAYSCGQSSPLPELPFQYADYAVWQHAHSQGEILKEGVEYWRHQLAGALPALQLPTDRPRPAMQSFRGAMQPLALSQGLTEALRILSRQEGVTLFMTLLAAFDTLLYRYSGQEDILVGSITAGRNYPGTEKLLGFFLNTVVLRADLSGNPSFRELLVRVRNTAVGALSHDDVPLDRLVKELHPDRDVSRNPLFQILLSMEPALPFVEAGWDLTPIDLETGTSKFDLCLVLDDRAAGLLGRVIYNTDLFDAATISRMMDCWRTLLEAVVADPEQKISLLPLTSQAERNLLLVEWNNTRKSYPLTLVHNRFESQARKTPDQVAVKCGLHQLTYRELDLRSNQLARYLTGLGVGPGVTVALCLDRSLEMITGILGILKAGGAYVPLDPTYPAERLEFMLADCRVPVLLTLNHLAVPSQTACTTIRLDVSWKEIEKESAEPHIAAVAPEALAYVIYTSGSTGVPKGVLVTHRNLAQSTSARLDYYDGPADRFLLLSSFGFDSSMVGIFHTLCSGGCLVLPEPDFNWGQRQLADLISQNHISHMLAIPSLYTELLEAAAPDQLSTLRTVIMAGEPCPLRLVEQHHALLPRARLYNEYGPTETTVWSTVYRCEPLSVPPAVPIGRPIANTQLYVLDRNLQLLPVGLPGELCIGGDGVAAGYLNQPDLTREKFLPNPFTDSLGGRIYKTGDLVRYLSDGNLEFLGRVDQQVKIRGLRIELGEIEAACIAHPDVREAVVLVEGDNSARSRLVAYIVPKEEYATSADELRAFLRIRLPAYLVPSVFSFVEVLPRTPNGKIDRSALPSPDSPQAAAVSVTAPLDSIEARLLVIWKDVLRIDISDTRLNFFELGGHSLLAAKLLDRIEKDFGQTLSLAFVFRAPTIEQMADALRSPHHNLRERAIIPIQPKGTLPPLFWIRGGPRFRLLAQTLGTDQPFLGLDLPYIDGVKLPVPYRFEDISAFLIQAMREVQPHGPYYVAGLCVNAVIAYEVAQQLVRSGEEVALLAMLDAHNQAYYKNPFKDHRYSARIKYHLANLLQLDARETTSYMLDRLDEARRKVERVIWRLSSERSGQGKDGTRNTDSIVHPAFSRYEPQPYSGKIVLLQSSDWPSGPYFDFKLGWDDLVTGGIDFHRIPGDHPSMFTEPVVELVASKLSTYLHQPGAAAKRRG